VRPKVALGGAGTECRNPHRLCESIRGSAFARKVSVTTPCWVNEMTGARDRDVAFLFTFATITSCGETNPLGRGIIVTAALSSIRPPEEQAVTGVPKSVPEKLAPGYHIESQSDRQPVRMKAAASERVSKRSAKDSRCSFCRAELGESLELTIPGSGKHGQHASMGCFCSTHCRNCVLALAALHPSPLASYDFISQRALVTDRLLDLWRHGQGPDPVLVLEAANRAGCGLPTGAPEVAAQAGPWLLSESA
jgi:hypothetical protein